MSIESRPTDPVGQTHDLDRRLDEPAVFDPPEQWALSTSWRRAQTETDHGGPLNDAERHVFLDESENPHRVLFVIKDGELRAECDCDGWHYNDWCAHVASCWWQWVNGRLTVVDVDDGTVHLDPPWWLWNRGGDPL